MSLISNLNVCNVNVNINKNVNICNGKVKDKNMDKI